MAFLTIDLFCGAGGSSAGARSAGAEILYGVDSWKLACDVFEDNFPDAIGVNANVNGRWLDGAFPAFSGIDLILASPECTNHTCAKGSAERDERSKRTAMHVLRYSTLLSPRWMVIENVVHMRQWQGYQALVDRLNQDYFVRAQTLDAADFGVPQTRRRLFLMCDRDRMPDELKLPTTARNRVAAAAILDPAGTWPSTPLYLKSRADATIERAERAIAFLGKRKPFLIVYYGSDGAGGWQTLDRPLRTLTTLDRFGLVEWEGNVPRLRMLQVPELKRAMGWEDSFVLDRGTRREKIMMLGNGVSPPVMKAVVSALTTHRPAGASLEAVKAEPVM